MGYIVLVPCVLFVVAALIVALALGMMARYDRSWDAKEQR